MEWKIIRKIKLKLNLFWKMGKKYVNIGILAVMMPEILMKNFLSRISLILRKIGLILVAPPGLPRSSKLLKL